MPGAHRAPSRGSTGHRRSPRGTDRHDPYTRDPHAPGRHDHDAYGRAPQGGDPYGHDPYAGMPYERDPYGRATPRRAVPVPPPVRSGVRSATAGVLAGVLGMSAVTAVVVLMSRSGDSAERAGAPAAAQSDLQPPPRTGPVVRFQTPEGYGYALAAVSHTTAASLAQADYVLTNTGSQPAPLEFPADLFVLRDRLSAETLTRCMPEPVAGSRSCTPPAQSRIIRHLHGSRPPVIAEGGERMMPAGASYLVRVTTDLPVAANTQPGDLRLVVWKVRYSPERKGIVLPAP